MPLSTPRIAVVDVARGLALLGMFSVHVFGAFEPDDSPTVAWQLAGGRSSATFALVAGVGLALTTGGRTPRVDRGSLASVAARAATVGLIGLLLRHALLLRRRPEACRCPSTKPWSRGRPGTPGPGSGEGGPRGARPSCRPTDPNRHNR